MNFLNAHPRIYLFILEKEEGGEREREKNIYQLSPVGAPYGNRTCDLGSN